MAGPYKALTYIHLPGVEKDYKPGEMIDQDDLDEAEQTEEQIQELIDSGAIGGEDDDIHPQNIIPDPSVPTIASVVSDARRTIEDMKARGEEVPDELQAVADLDFTPVSTDDAGAGGEK